MFYPGHGQPECFPFGDVAGDCDVDNNDATTLAAIISSGNASSIADINALADLTLDGVISQADLNLHSNYIIARTGGSNVLSVDAEANDVGYAW